jgi:hypothetical protein
MMRKMKKWIAVCSSAIKWFPRQFPPSISTWCPGGTTIARPATLEFYKTAFQQFRKFTMFSAVSDSRPCL